MTTQEFIKQYRHDNVRWLAFLQDKYPEVDLPFALDQIRGWQTARHKLPAWAAQEGLIYPPHLSMEQCSSEATAQLKADIVARLCPERRQLVDLTGGFGVDFSYLARSFDKAVYVERQEHLCTIARHNLALLRLTQAEVVCADSTEYLERMEPVDLIFIDPARRDSHGGRTFAIADCVPDVVALRPLLMQKARWLLLKLSPMLDWHKAVKDVGSVSDVFIVAVGGECKELLLLVEHGYTGSPHLHCVDDGVEWQPILRPTPALPKITYPGPPKGRVNNQRTGSVPPLEDSSIKPKTSIVIKPKTPIVIKPKTSIVIKPKTSIVNSQSADCSPSLWEGRGRLFLLLPSVSVMKAGCFAAIEQAFGLRQLAPNSHLFLSDTPVEDFPGRTFRLLAVSSFNKKELRKALVGIDKANLAVRNFPMTVEELRRKLKLKDGGDHYIYATTDAEGHHLLLIGQKV